MSAQRQSDRAFGLTFAVVFAAILAVGIALGQVHWWAAALSGLFAGCALVAPVVLLPLNRMWAALALRLGRFSTFALLGLFFYLVILPFGWTLRLLGRDPLARAPRSDADTYLTKVPRQLTDETLPDLF